MVLLKNQLIQMVKKTLLLNFIILSIILMVFEFQRKTHPLMKKIRSRSSPYACHQSGDELESTSILQAKRRVEQLNQTL